LVFGRGHEHDDAADGVLVVQVCRLGAISREIPQFATREELMRLAVGGASGNGAGVLSADGCNYFSGRAFPV
jgi:hypothetical protein